MYYLRKVVDEGFVFFFFPSFLKKNTVVSLSVQKN